MLLLSVIIFSLGLESYVRAASIRRAFAQAANDTNTILYDGRAPPTLTAADIDQSNGPYLAYVIYYILPSNASTREIAV
jgi:hypothetical protein